MMEFLDGKVARETQYFGDPFELEPSRAQCDAPSGSAAWQRVQTCIAGRQSYDRPPGRVNSALIDLHHLAQEIERVQDEKRHTVGQDAARDQ